MDVPRLLQYEVHSAKTELNDGNFAGPDSIQAKLIEQTDQESLPQPVRVHKCFWFERGSVLSKSIIPKMPKR